MSNLFNLTLKIFHHQQLFQFFPYIGEVQNKGNRFQHPTILKGLWGLYPSLCYLSYFRKRNMGTSSLSLSHHFSSHQNCVEWKTRADLPLCYWKLTKKQVNGMEMILSCIPLLSGPHMYNWCKGFLRSMHYPCCEAGKYQVLELSDPTSSATF